MNIAVIGLGLIGGSFCKAIKSYTKHAVLGLDADPNVQKEALNSGAIDQIITEKQLHQADLSILALYPEASIQFVEQNRAAFRPGSIVMDTCGIKQKVVEAIEPLFSGTGVSYVGTHPMAGREFSGFDYALADLYQGASFIITPTEQTDKSAIQTVTDLAERLGFGRIVHATPQEHDRIIAYTSQLAHVVSSAYVKSPTLKAESGFSAGSFKDLTRVAKLNPEMWTSLFLDNRTALLTELDAFLDHLREYRTALEIQDRQKLFELLEDGNERKIWSLNHSK